MPRQRCGECGSVSDDDNPVTPNGSPDDRGDPLEPIVDLAEVLQRDGPGRVEKLLENLIVQGDGRRRDYAWALEYVSEQKKERYATARFFARVARFLGSVVFVIWTPMHELEMFRVLVITKTINEPAVVWVPGLVKYAFVASVAFSLFYGFFTIVLATTE